jgi:lysophospholipase L1-like esterase
MSIRFSLLVMALSVALSASPAQAQVRTPTHVACVGDSITYGYMASSASASYPSVKNYGHNSATMLSTGDLPYPTLSEYTAATTFVSGAGTSAVVDVIIMLGTNDSKSYNWMSGTSTRAQQFVTDCGAMVDHFASLPTHPLVYLAFPPRAFANSYGISGTIIHDQILPLIQQVATAKNVPIIDVDTPTASQSNLFPDGVHPNDTGYALVAKVMHDGLGGAAGQGGAGGRGGASGQAGQTGQGGQAQGGQGGKAGSSGSGGAAGSGGHGGQPGGTGGTSAGGGHGGQAGGLGGSNGAGGAGGISASGGRGGAGQGGQPGQGGSSSGAGTAGTSSGGNGQGGSGSGGSATASGGAGGGATEVDAGNSDSGGSGCSCTLASRGPSGSVGLLFATLAALALLMRRSPRRR